jgi:hypothetical protein
MTEPLIPDGCIPQADSPPPCRQMLSSDGLVSHKTAQSKQPEATIPSYQLRGNSECGCPSCHRIFSSERAFDLHRVGEYSEGRKCAENLSSVGLELDSRGRWRVPR